MIERRIWSNYEDRKLIEMRSIGKSFRLIAKALGRSEMACAARWYINLGPEVIAQALDRGCSDANRNLAAVIPAQRGPLKGIRWAIARMLVRLAKVLTSWAEKLAP
jgi:hypothetical protein